MNLHAPYSVDDDFASHIGGKHGHTQSGYTPRSIAGLALIVAAVTSALLLTNCASSPSRYSTANDGKIVWEAGPTPRGWPAPGPLNTVSVKRYPAYRSAVAEVFSENDGSMKLHAHLRVTGIPMGSPVEIAGVFEDKGWQVKSMSFLYPSMRLGKTGFADPSVVVRDNVPIRTLSYAWVGEEDQQHLALAKQALDDAALVHHQHPGAYRLLVSPGRTFELQTLIR